MVCKENAGTQVSTPNAKSPAELFDDFIKLEWQDIFRKEVHVRLDNGARYVPNSGARGVQLLRKDVNAFEEAIRLWSGPNGDADNEDARGARFPPWSRARVAASAGSWDRAAARATSRTPAAAR